MLFDKLSIGVDIEDISRFRSKPFGINKHFYENIFSDSEIKYSLSKSDPYPHFAVRFCAKEAFIKAENSAFGKHKVIEVILENNKPFILWNKNKFLVSLSHEKDKAVAFVVVSKVKL